MKKLTESLNKILEGYDFEVNERQRVIDEISLAVKETMDYVIGEDIDGDKSYASTDYILGHHDRGGEAKERAAESL